MRHAADNKTPNRDYDAERVKHEVLEICDYYLTDRRREGRRYTYRCPECGGRRFEVEPVRAMAGCFSAECGLPKTTDAIGIIGYMETLDTHGAWFVECLKKGYEILGLDTAEQTASDARSKSKDSSTRSDTTDSGRPDQPKGRSWIAGEAKAHAQHGPDEPEDHTEGPGPMPEGKSNPVTDSLTDYPVSVGRPIEAYTELTDGTRIPLEAFVLDEHAAEDSQDDERSSRAISSVPARKHPASHQGSASEAPAADTDKVRGCQDEQRDINHKVYEVLLRLCPLEERERTFFEGRGLDEATIQDGRFGSISKKRCRYVTQRLERRFPDEELLSVPGFHRADSGQLRFTLYGEYALIPYYDREGYILTVEGRLTGAPTRDGDPKYKALASSGVHLYVHPSFDSGGVVAFCEGAIGAMVAARSGIPVASIKGMRNYRQPPEGRYGDYTVLPELAGVDFGGKEIVYFPDLDVKPKTREEAFGVVPEACEWLINRQGGKAKVGMLPEGYKDLDEWLLSVPEDERVRRFLELVHGAVPVESWEPADGEPADGEPTGQPDLQTPLEESATEAVTGDEGGYPQGAREDSPQHIMGHPEQTQQAVPCNSGSGKTEEDKDQKEDKENIRTTGTAVGKSFQRKSTRNQGDEPIIPLKDQEHTRDDTLNTPNPPNTPPASSRVRSPENESGVDPFKQPDTTEMKTDRDQEHHGGGEPGVENHEGDECEGDTRPQPAGRLGLLQANPNAWGTTARESAWRSHPGMERWHATRDMSEEQVERVRAATEYHARIGRYEPERSSRQVRVPKWNAGEVFIAISAAVFVAVLIGVLAYLARSQTGLVGTIGTLMTLPAWWLEATLYWLIGSMVAERVTRVRHRIRQRQIRDHVRGGRREGTR